MLKKTTASACKDHSVLIIFQTGVYMLNIRDVGLIPHRNCPEFRRLSPRRASALSRKHAKQDEAGEVKNGTKNSEKRSNDNNVALLDQFEGLLDRFEGLLGQFEGLLGHLKGLRRQFEGLLGQLAALLD